MTDYANKFKEVEKAELEKGNTFYVSHHEWLSDMFNMVNGEIIENGNAIMHTRDSNRKKETLTIWSIDTLCSGKSRLFFSDEEILVYAILLEYFIRNNDQSENDYLKISIKKIHNDYRDKTFRYSYDNGKSGVPKSTLMRYRNIISSLCNKSLEYCCIDKRNKRKRTFTHKLVDFNNYDNEYDEFNYSLGEFGHMLLESNRMSFGSREILEVCFKSLRLLRIYLYIARMIFINSRQKKKPFIMKRSINAILSGVMYSKNGIPTGRSYFAELKTNKDNASNVFKTFIDDLNKVLTIFSDSGKIEELQIKRCKVKYVLDDELYFEIKVLR